MIRRISIHDLQVGMYVVHPGFDEAKLDPHLYSLEGFILSAEELEQIAQKGFTTAKIDDARRLNNTAKPAPTPPPVPTGVLQPTVPFAVELEKANAVCQNALVAAQNLYLRLGTSKASNAPMLQVEQTRPLFEDIATSLVHNHNVLQALSNLRTDDEYTYTHCLNVGLYTGLLGSALGVAQDSIPELVMAGFFHDIGKIFIPENIIKFPGKLNAVQFATVRKHSELGYEYLCKQPDLPETVLLAARDHHERPDGQGYPFGRKANEISFIGRVVAVADVYDALSSVRPYKTALPSSVALGMMYKQREECFSPGFLEQFIHLVGVYPPGSLVRLNNGQSGVVMECNDEDLLRPTVLPLTSADGLPLRKLSVTDLAKNPDVTITEAINSIPGKPDVQAILKRFASAQ